MAAETTALAISLLSGSPASVRSSRRYATFVALPSHDGPDLIAVEFEQPDDQLKVFLREISPAVTYVLSLKIAAWVEAKISRLAGTVVEAATNRLRELGYIE